MQSSMATSIAPNPFRETWSKYLSSSCTVHSLLLPCHCQNRAWRSNWVRAVRRRQKLPVANVVLSLWRSLALRSDDAIDMLWQFHTRHFDATSRQPSMAKSAAILTCLSKVFGPFAYTRVVCLFKSACNCKSNTTELTTLFDKSR